MREFNQQIYRVGVGVGVLGVPLSTSTNKSVPLAGKVWEALSCNKGALSSSHPIIQSKVCLPPFSFTLTLTFSFFFLSSSSVIGCSTVLHRGSRISEIISANWLILVLRECSLLKISTRPFTRESPTLSDTSRFRTIWSRDRRPTWHGEGVTLCFTDSKGVQTSSHHY